MAKVKNYSSKDESIKSVWNNKGDNRYGFVSRDRVQDPVVADRYYTRYGAGIDNLPLGGYNERSINTPLGTFDYGNDQDTAFAGFTPNLERTRGTWQGGNGNTIMADYLRSYLGDAILQAGRQGEASNPDYFAGAFLPGDKQYIPDFDKNISTPLGNLEVQSNYDVPNSLDASLTPNHYMQALLNLINRGR